MKNQNFGIEIELTGITRKTAAKVMATPSDEMALDRYEGYPNLYRKETVTVTTKKGAVDAMVYIMNAGQAMMPNRSYYDTIEEGYMDVGLDPTHLHEALEDTAKRMKAK